MSGGIIVQGAPGGGGGLAAASQSDQETATSTTLAVTPGTAHFHPSAAKWWACITVSGGTPTLAASYNVTSITDTGVGKCTVTIATDYSSVNWSGWVVCGAASGYEIPTFASKAAGSILLNCVQASPGTGTFADPLSYDAGGFGDQ